MHFKFKSAFFLALLLAFNIILQAQTFSLKQSNENGIYKRGDKIAITAITEGNPGDSILLKVWKNNDQLLLKKSIPASDNTTILYSGTMKKPCSLRFEANLKGNIQNIGLIVDPTKIKPGTKRPKDIDAYWFKEKKELEALRMKANSNRILDVENGFVVTDTEINCAGQKPVRGYFAKPYNARAKSLPIVIFVHAAGVKGAWCRSEVNNALAYAKMGNGALCFDLNAHGMLNGQPDEYYANLEKGELKNYFFQGIENREDLYFRGMYLRLLRTIEYMTLQPEWDRKRILVIGESQGGGQALAAAGLDSRVTAVVATVPAMCDWGGTLVNRKGGWPQPFTQAGNQENMMKTLPYFDCAHLLKNSKATIVVEIGLSDETCPSTSVYAAINQSKGNKIIYPVPYREHHSPTDELFKTWETMVLNPRNEFISNYLK